MKANLVNIRITLLVVFIMLVTGFRSVNAAGSITDTYTALISGDAVVDQNTAYFTLWIKSGTGINFRTFQGTIWISNAFLNTTSENVKVEWVAGSSDIGATLNTHQIVTPSKAGGTTPGTDGNYSIIRLNTLSKDCPGTLISNTFQRIGQIKLTRTNGADGTWGCVDNKIGFYTGPNAGLKTTFAITDWVAPFGSGANVTLPVNNGTFQTNLNNQTPVITAQPVPASVFGIARAAMFSVTATSVNPGDAEPTYQWYDNENPTMPLTNSSLYSGVNSPTLTITNPGEDLNGHNYFVNASQCNSVTSDKAMLTVNLTPIVHVSNPYATGNNGNIEGNTGLNSISTSTTGANGFPSSSGNGASAPLANHDGFASALPGTQNLNMVAYPNPAHDKFTLSFSSNKDGGNYSLRIIDILGRVIVNQINAAQKGRNIVDLDLSNYGKGSYMISVTTEGGAKQEVLSLILE